jgi:hypothetical protein
LLGIAGKITVLVHVKCMFDVTVFTGVNCQINDTSAVLPPAPQVRR